MRISIDYSVDAPGGVYTDVKEWVVKDGLFILTKKDEKRGAIIPVSNILRISIELEDDDPEGSV